MYLARNEQKSTRYPLPTGEGQTDTPINQHNQGEVLTPPIEKSVFIDCTIHIMIQLWGKRYNIFILHYWSSHACCPSCQWL